MLERYGPLTLPWVVPLLTGFQSHSKLLQHTLCFLSFKKFKYQLVIYGFSGSFLVRIMFHRVKSFAEVHSNKANCFTIQVSIQVAVDPMLNGQESIGTVSTFSVGELWGAEVAFNCLAGIAVVHNFLKSPRYNRSYINAAIITMCFRNIHFGEGKGLTPRACMGDGGSIWWAPVNLYFMVCLLYS